MKIGSFWHSQTRGARQWLQCGPCALLRCTIICFGDDSATIEKRESISHLGYSRPPYPGLRAFSDFAEIRIIHVRTNGRCGNAAPHPIKRQANSVSKVSVGTRKRVCTDSRRPARCESTDSRRDADSMGSKANHRASGCPCWRDFPGLLGCGTVRVGPSPNDCLSMSKRLCSQVLAAFS